MIITGPLRHRGLVWSIYVTSYVSHLVIDNNAVILLFYQIIVVLIHHWQSETQGIRSKCSNTPLINELQNVCACLRAHVFMCVCIEMHVCSGISCCVYRVSQDQVEVLCLGKEMPHI